MSIEFLVAQDGYMAGTVVHTLPASREAAYIGRGVAVDVTVPRLPLDAREENDGIARIVTDAATGTAAVVSSAGNRRISMAGVVANVDPMTATLTIGDVVARRSELGMASMLALRLIRTSTIPSITNPLGEWGCYFATDHAIRGGIRLMYTDDPEGRWSIYTGGLASGDNTIIYEDIDQSGTGTSDQCETPFPIYDPVLGVMRMMYQVRTPNYGGTAGTKANPTDPNGAANNATYVGFGQGTLCAIQTDAMGVRFTKDRDWRLLTGASTGPLGAGDHSGYMNIHWWRDRYIAHHLLGSDKTGAVGRSFASDLAQWYVNYKCPPLFPRQCAAVGMLNSTWRWAASQPFETAGGAVVMARISSVVSGTDVPEFQAYAAARFNGELTEMQGLPRLLTTEVGLNFSNWVATDDGRLMALTLKNIGDDEDTEIRVAYLG